MGIINKLYDVHAVPSKNVQFPLMRKLRKILFDNAILVYARKPPPGLPRLPMSIDTFSEFGVLFVVGATSSE